MKVINTDIRSGLLTIESINVGWIHNEALAYYDEDCYVDNDYYYDFDKDLTKDEEYKIHQLLQEFSIDLDSLICRWKYNQLEELIRDLISNYTEIFYTSKEEGDSSYMDDN